MLDCSLYGLWAGGHHLTNVLLHAAASVVLFLALRRLTGAVWRSGIVAALFCLHPLHVESVAWVSERKDVLSGLFFGLTLWAYAGYAERPFSWATVPGGRRALRPGTALQADAGDAAAGAAVAGLLAAGRWRGAGSGEGEAGSGDEPKQSPTAFFPSLTPRLAFPPTGGGEAAAHGAFGRVVRGDVSCPALGRGGGRCRRGR